MELDNPRQLAKKALKASVPATLWSENEKFITKLRASLKTHSVATHPAIEALNKGCFSKEQIKLIHLDYRHAIVQIFTDALLMAQYQSRQVEPRLLPGSKMYGRFLLTLNDLDEFGFQPGLDKYGYYRGNPYNAHYPLFERVLDALGISHQERLEYVPTRIAHQVRKYLEQTYHDFSSVTSLLAIAEEEVVLFSAPLRENTRAVGVNVDSGYYFCHGTTLDMQADANDDDHEDDLWYVLMQALTPAQYDDIAKLCNRYCDLWVEFWNTQMTLLGAATELMAIQSR